MAELRQGSNGTWNVVIWINSGVTLPSSLEIPVELKYEGLSYTVNVSRLEKTVETEWRTPLGTAITTSQIEMSYSSVTSGDTVYGITGLTWDEVVPYDEATANRRELRLSLQDDFIISNGTTVANLRYLQYEDNVIITDIPISGSDATWSSSDTTVATVSAGTVNGCNTTSATKTASIVCQYSGLTISTMITVGGTSGEEVEPTGITLDAHTVNLTTYTNLSKFVHATVSPANATNKNIIWESSDRSVVTVKAYKGVQNGWIEVAHNAKIGTAVVKAYTYDRRYSDSCNVTVTGEGTYITGITPSDVYVPWNGGTETVQILSTYVGRESGFTAVSNGTQTSFKFKQVDGSTYNLTIGKNMGNAVTFPIYVHGNFSGDDGSTMYVHQEGCTVISGFKYHDRGYCYANGNFYHNWDDKDDTGITGTLDFVCAVGYGREIVSEVTSDSDWLYIKPQNFGSMGDWTYTGAQYMEYEDYGTIDGKDPGFQGRTTSYWVGVGVDANTGSERVGHLIFPGGKKFTIYQQGV